MYSLVKPLYNSPVGRFLTPTRIFIASTLVVNAGNYAYNLGLGRWLSPAEFADAGLMVTLLLVASFVGMTFQIVATKFTVDLDERFQDGFRGWLGQRSLLVGALISVAVLLWSKELSGFFQLSSPWPIVVFGLMLPLFFLMSVKRGYLQGAGDFIALSTSYQSEMWGRVAATVGALAFLRWGVDLQVGMAILISVAFGYLVIHTPSKVSFTRWTSFAGYRRVWQFLALTAGYEASQILINYSDILMVKHYFNAESAGLYTSMALIGRMIYFMTWMVVMVLVPKVLQMRKDGEDYQQALIKYFGVIASFSAVLIVGAYVFADEIVLVLFGKAYLPVSSLLWKYGLATMLFALANLLVYYFLSIDMKLPVYIAIGFGILQVVLLSVYHSSLDQMVLVQIINMGALLGLMVGHFVWSWTSAGRRDGTITAGARL